MREGPRPHAGRSPSPPGTTAPTRAHRRTIPEDTMTMIDVTAHPTAQATEAAGTNGRARRRRRAPAEQTPRHLRSNRTAYLMIAPMAVLLGIFVIWPLVYAFYLSFFELSFYKDAKFVGL